MSTATAIAAGVEQRRSISLPNSGSLIWLYALVGALFAMHLSMVFGRSINWDEFWFYSQVETLARGEFVRPLQTIHTRAFYWWLPGMPGSEVDHIVIARLVMLACLTVTSIGIFLAAEKFSDKRTALLALALYLGAGYVLHHGTSFRVDPIVTAFLASGFAIAARTRLRLPSILALGIIIGCAAMVTIKFVLWAPAFAGLALWRWQDEEWDWRYPLRWVAAGVVALGVFALLYVWHGVDMAGRSAADEAALTLTRSSGKMFGFFHSPHIDVVMKGVATALPLVLTALLVPLAASKMDAPWTRRVAVIAMWFPILTPIYYYNAHPYFYAFILPPVAVSCAFAIPLILARYSQGALAAVIGLSAMAIWFVDARGVADKQRILVETVHQIVPEPVNYFDCCGMIGSYPKANHFLTRWGIEVYQDTNRPLLLEAMNEKPVPLLINNNQWFFPDPKADLPAEIHPLDEKAIAETFVQYWGDVYLAGRELDPGSRLDWQVRVPGTYTVRGDLIVAGSQYRDGDLVDLERGLVAIENTGDAKAMLVWGKTPFEPSITPPDNYWTAF